MKDSIIKDNESGINFSITFSINTEVAIGTTFETNGINGKIEWIVGRIDSVTVSGGNLMVEGLAIKNYSKIESPL